MGATYQVAAAEGGVEFVESSSLRPVRIAALSSPPWGQVGEVLAYYLHVLGLGDREFAEVDDFRRDVHLGVGGVGRVVPGVMHGAAGDPPGLGDQSRVLLTNLGRFGLGPG
jgi:hypothetical protein